MFRRRSPRVAPALTAAFCVALALASSTAAAERLVIGHSVRGRPIVVVRSGDPNPALKVLIVGAIHGDERAGMPIARRLIRGAAPPSVGLWVLPTINPDGVDLNRNFPHDWRPLSGGEYSGTGPLSEPESRVALRLIRRVEPDLTIWFHQPFGIVDRPPGNPFVARRYGQLIGLPIVSLPGRYPGSATRWQNHTFPASTAFVVELPSVVSGALSRRASAAIRSLAGELASPSVGRGATAP